MNKKKIIGIILVVVVLLLVIGTTYSIYSYRGLGSNQELVMGDIYMYYNEVKSIDIDQATTRTSYDPDNYFEFTVSGKNTYTKKDIYYEIVLSHGDTPENRSVRIDDKFLRFRLVEVKDGEEVEIVNNISLSVMENNRIWVNTIDKNTLDEITVRYRLYMWIDDSVRIGYVKEGSTAKIDYDFDTWNNEVFASIKVNVSGDFMEKEGITFSKLFRTILNSKPSTTITDTDGTIYLSGSFGTSEASGEVANYPDFDAVDYNFVWYSGKLWRITAIYPDGTMKMITDNAITTINWGEKATISETDLTSAYSTSYIREWLNQEFLPTLYNYENIIVEDAGWYSITDSDSDQADKPTGDYTLTDPVGLLNSYERQMACTVYKNEMYVEYSDCYLNTGYDWWTITPMNYSYVSIMFNYGYSSITNVSQSIGVRPSVVLKSNIQFTGGEGTRNNPYRIKGDQEQTKANVTLINTRQSGEYVKLSSDETAPTFRIIGTELVGENLTTKIVLNDYVKDTNDVDADSNTTEVLMKYFSSSDSYELWTEVDKTDTTYWRGYLNNTWIKEIDNTYNETDGTSSILEKGTYYLGYHTTGSYKTTVCSSVSSDVSVRECIENGTVVTNTINDDYVGLLRVGEMFASQLNDRYTANAMTFFSITPYDSSYVRLFYFTNSLSNYQPSFFTYAARPTINLKSEIVIKSGSGTKQAPFVVGLPV